MIRALVLECPKCGWVTDYTQYEYTRFEYGCPNCGVKFTRQDVKFLDECVIAESEADNEPRYTKP